MSNGDWEDLAVKFAKLSTKDQNVTMEELLKAILETNKIQQQTNATLVEEQRCANELKAKELQLRMSQDSKKVRASDFIPKMGVTNDMEAYLYAFETTAHEKSGQKNSGVGTMEQ